MKTATLKNLAFFEDRQDIFEDSQYSSKTAKI